MVTNRRRQNKLLSNSCCGELARKLIPADTPIEPHQSQHGITIFFTGWLKLVKSICGTKIDVTLVSKVPILIIFTGNGENVKNEELAKAVKWKKLITKVLKQVRKRKRKQTHIAKGMLFH